MRTTLWLPVMIANYRAFGNVVKFLAANIGSQVSPSSISKALKADNQEIHHATVEKFIDYLVESFVFYKVNRFDVKGKKQLATQEKYYLVDLGLRYALLGRELVADAGHLLENVIFLELLRRNYQIWIGKTDNLEVDFVVRDKNGYTRYIQVAYTVKERKTLERELAPFNKIPDFNERLLITMDYETGSHNGVKQINAIDWFLNNQKND